MAFCTECGYRLPEEAVFCPNCGSSLRAPQSDQTEAQPQEAADSMTEETAGPTPAQEPQPESEQPLFQTSGVYVESAPVGAVPPAANTYPPAPNYGYAPQNQSAFAPPPPQYSAPSPYGYAPHPGGTALAEKPKMGSGTVAAIVISSVVVLLALAAILIFKPFGGSSRYLGYWETVAVDVGDGVISEDYYGMDVIGALGIQINKDNSAYLGSSDDYEVSEGTWHKTDGGILIQTEDDDYLLLYQDKQLLLSKDGETFYFEKIKGRDINNPTIPHGSLSGYPEMGDDDYHAGTTVSGSGDVGDGNYYISVIGAESFTDIDGDPAIRIYYEFTNHNEEYFSAAAWDVLSDFAEQDGQQLMATYSTDYDTYSYASYKIRPGVTLQCFSEYKYNPYGGSVDFSVSGYYEGESAGLVTATYTPDSLPGAPAPFVIVPIANPQWTLGIAADGALDEFYVRVADAELLEDYNGNPAIRVYYEFTNNSSYTTSLGDELYLYTYQDGISLDYTYASEDSDTDMNYYAETAPGDTTYLSCIFLLRNQTSQVEAEVEAYYDYVAVGQTYNITD